MSLVRQGAPFREEQRFSPLLGFLPVALAGGLVWVLFQTGLGHGARGKPASALIPLLAVVAVAALVVPLLVLAKLTVEVGGGEIRVRFFPFLKKAIALSEVVSCESRTYRPILEYGGWGVRYSLRNGWAYNVRGNRGVQLRLKDGKRILIGSQRPEELAEALRKGMSR